MAGLNVSEGERVPLYRAQYAARRAAVAEHVLAVLGEEPESWLGLVEIHSRVRTRARVGKGMVAAVLSALERDGRLECRTVRAAGRWNVTRQWRLRAGEPGVGGGE